MSYIYRNLIRIGVALLCVSIIGGAVAQLVPGLFIYVTSFPSGLSLGYESKPFGPNPIFELGSMTDYDTTIRPNSYRYMLIPALYTNSYGTEDYMQNRWEWADYGDQLVTEDAPDWSEWIDWPMDGAPVLEFNDLPKYDDQNRLIHYMLALEAQNAEETSPFCYGGSVINFYVSESGTPAIQLREVNLGTMRYDTSPALDDFQVVAGRPLDFAWTGNAGLYAEVITSYRWGVDLTDPDDPNDPGWAGPPGLGEDATGAEISLSAGSHTFTVEAVDSHGGLTRLTQSIDAIPVPDAADRLPLLLIDDVRDASSNAWPDETGLNHYDNDVMRDARWLELIGDLPGFDPSRDVLDLERGDMVDLSDLVNYRVVIWTTRDGDTSFIARNFTPSLEANELWGDRPRIPYNWLLNYQRHAGNLMLIGSGAVFNFHRQAPDGVDWLYPVVYELNDGIFGCDEGFFARSFEDYDPGDGSITTGMMTYPYLGLGLSLTDKVWAEVIYESLSVCLAGNDARHRYCGATKGLFLDEVFLSAHASPDELPAAIATWDELDWADLDGDLPDIFQSTVLGIWDEFYELDATARPESWSARTRPDGSPMVEPMWRLQTRYDWIREQHRAAGDTDFPEFDPAEFCGEGLFDPGTPTGTDAATLIDGAPIGLFTYAAVETKPGGLPDVVWGFDPTRFDPAAMTQAVRWVLGTHFGLAVIVGNEPTDPETPQPVIPDCTRLRPAAPNPFNPLTELAYSLDRPGRVEISVYDLQGRRVATLFDGRLPAGEHVATWTGCDDTGRGLSSGGYIVRLDTETDSSIQRVTLLK